MSVRLNFPLMVAFVEGLLGEDLEQMNTKRLEGVPEQVMRAGETSLLDLGRAFGMSTKESAHKLGHMWTGGYKLLHGKQPMACYSVREYL